MAVRPKRGRPTGTCDHCGKTMLKTTLTNLHFKICPSDQNAEKIWKCTHPGCSSKFLLPNYLQIHELRTHKRKYQREACPYRNCDSVLKKDNLVKHIKRVHRCRKVIEQVNCPKCLKTLKKSYLPSHLRSACADQREKKFTCRFEGCNACFFTRQGLSAHESDKHKPMEWCGFPKCNYRGQYLSNHITAIHERPNKTCEDCGLVVKSRSYKDHRLVCTSRDGEKIFQCTYEGCERAFTTKVQRYNHLKVHKPKIKCPKRKCGAEISPNYLSTHIREVHKQQKMPGIDCPICERTLSYHALSRHVSRKHPQDVDKLLEIRKQIRNTRREAEDLARTNWYFEIKEKING